MTGIAGDWPPYLLSCYVTLFWLRVKFEFFSALWIWRLTKIMFQLKHNCNVMINGACKHWPPPPPLWHNYCNSHCVLQEEYKFALLVVAAFAVAQVISPLVTNAMNLPPVPFSYLVLRLSINGDLYGMCTSWHVVIHAQDKTIMLNRLASDVMVTIEWQVRNYKMGTQDT